MARRRGLTAASFFALLIAFAFGQESAQPLGESARAPLTLGQLEGTALKLDGANLLIGMRSGNIANFDTYTRLLKYEIQNEGIGPVLDLALFGKQVWWCVEGSRSVFTALPGKSPFEIDVSASGLGPVDRITIWQQMIVAHSNNGIRFIDPMSWRVMTPMEALPSDVAAIANSAVVTTQWKDGKGIFVAVRRSGPKKNPKPGELSDLGVLTAWSAEWRGEYKLLGSYTSDLIDFGNAKPDVPARGPAVGAANSVPSGSIGNLRVGPEGIVVLDHDEALTIPFYSDNWITERVSTTVAPHYPQSSAFYGNDVWWVDNGKLVHSSLEDGSSETYLARSKAKVISVVADEEGAWVLREDGIRRIEQEELAQTAGFVRFVVGPDEELPGYGGQAKLAWIIKQAKKPGAKKVAAKDSLGFVRLALKSAGISDKKAARLLQPETTRVTDLQYGDVIVKSDRSGFYVGNGKWLALEKGGFSTKSLDGVEDATIHRFFASAPKIPAGAGSLPIIDIGPVFPIGLGKPRPYLGHDLFVRISPGAPWDQPHLPSHFRLLSLAEDWVGTPYRWGGQSMNGTDCSGFVMSVFSDLGIKLPRHSQWMARAPFGEVVFDELRFGDVLVYPHPKHVAIYIGDGRTVETTKGAVGYSTVYRRKIAYVRRFLMG